MGSGKSRRNLIAAVAAIAVAAVALVLVIALSGDDESGSTPSGPASQTSQTTATETTPTSQGSKKRSGRSKNGSSRQRSRGSKKEPSRDIQGTIRQRIVGGGVQTVRVKDGIPVGGLLRLIYERGDRVQLKIVSNHSERFVIPNLDVTEEGSPDHPAEFDFTANQSGLFGVELHAGGGRTRVAVLAIH
jgi:hypothetical protein